jgi:hypothetical protein
MEFITRTILPSLVAFSLLMLPAISFAASHTSLVNPVKFPTIERFIEGALRAVVTIALPIVAFFIVYSGFLFVKAQGNPDELKTAKENFKWVILGSALILGAWVLATLIAGTVSQLTR